MIWHAATVDVCGRVESSNASTITNVHSKILYINPNYRYGLTMYYVRV